ncbi:MAG TPA: N-methyl-L-tryptophan oxidase [Nocardioidaceae bacterium]|nr:N-methyl-L-tryptophan oxidase [Nocardioidaceae bacterium]
MTEQVEYVVIGLGALGSATASELTDRGADVVGLERFELGHQRGASHDSSRILRHSYHTPGYVRLTFDAYDDWDRLERASGERLVTTVGGLDLFPAGCAIPADDYVSSMTEVGVRFEVLDVAAIAARWPQFHVPADTLALYQSRAAIVPAARGTAALQRLARARGAVLRDSCPVLSVRDLGSRGVEVVTEDVTYRCRRLIVCADAWTNQVTAGLDWQVPLTVLQQQVTYFEPTDPARFARERMPLWIWMDDPSFYGFPCFGEPTVKMAEDCGGPEVDPDLRSFTADPARLSLLQAFAERILPGCGPPVRSLTCLYTMTPDRDFVLGPVPGHDAVLVGLGAAHGFKFAPTLGRLLADLATTGTTSADIEAFRADRAALTETDHAVSWLV